MPDTGKGQPGDVLDVPVIQFIGRVRWFVVIYRLSGAEGDYGNARPFKKDMVGAAVALSVLKMKLRAGHSRVIFNTPQLFPSHPRHIKMDKILKL